MKYTKCCPDAEYQAYWLRKLPPAYRPADVKFVPPNKLEYEEIDGSTPNDWRLVHNAAHKAFWGERIRGIDETHVLDYVEYVLLKGRTLLSAAEQLRLMRLLGSLRPTDLTPAYATHGDLTLENTLLVEGQVVFIDPGHDRGLQCREIDEAKILQSLDGWDYVRRPRCCQPVEQPHGFPARRVHWILLASHYVRLLCHQHPAVAMNFARGRLSQLLETL